MYKEFIYFFISFGLVGGIIIIASLIQKIKTKCLKYNEHIPVAIATVIIVNDNQNIERLENL